jgi:hypothetical protein
MRQGTEGRRGLDSSERYMGSVVEVPSAKPTPAGHAMQQ